MSNCFVLKKQPRPTGVSLIVDNQKVGGAFVWAETNETVSAVTIYSNRVYFQNEAETRQSTHTVSMTLAKNKSCVMKYGPDPRMDMFQVSGRHDDMDRCHDDTSGCLDDQLRKLIII